MSVAESPSSGMGGFMGVKIRSFYSAVTSEGNAHYETCAKLHRFHILHQFKRLCTFKSNLFSYFVGSLYFQRFFLDLRFYDQVKSYGHFKRVSSHNHTFFWASLTVLRVIYIFACNWPCMFSPSWISARRRMTEEIISWSICTKIWDQARIDWLATPVYAVRLATDCATGPSLFPMHLIFFSSFYTNMITSSWQSLTVYKKGGQTQSQD